MSYRLAVVLGNLVFLAVDGPGEWADIAHALFHPDAYYHWRLALGLLIRNALIVASIVGLLQRRRYGEVCLATESVHSIIIHTGAFQAVAPDYAAYWRQLVWPGLDIAFRLFCLAYVFVSKRGASA